MPLQADREDAGQDGTKRKAHYGAGVQPWDTIVEMGLGPAFAAGSILKYVRRTKDAEHSLESARWYLNQLKAHAKLEHRFVFHGTGAWDRALVALTKELTPAEMNNLLPPSTEESKA